MDLFEIADSLLKQITSTSKMTEGERVNFGRYWYLKQIEDAVSPSGDLADVSDALEILLDGFNGKYIKIFKERELAFTLGENENGIFVFYQQTYYRPNDFLKLWQAQKLKL